MKILFGVEQCGNINADNEEVKQIQTVSLLSIRDIHIGVIALFYIPINPSENRNNNQ